MRPGRGHRSRKTGRLLGLLAEHGPVPREQPRSSNGEVGAPAVLVHPMAPPSDVIPPAKSHSVAQGVDAPDVWDVAAVAVRARDLGSSTPGTGRSCGEPDSAGQSQSVFPANVRESCRGATPVSAASKARYGATAILMAPRQWERPLGGRPPLAASAAGVLVRHSRPSQSGSHSGSRGGRARGTRHVRARCS